MAKYAVYNIVQRPTDDTQLKKLSILFDKIYTGWYKGYTTKEDLLKGSSRKLIRQISPLIDEDFQLFDYLQEKNIIHDTRNFPREPLDSEYSAIIENQKHLYYNEFLPGLGKHSEEQASKILAEMVDNNTRLDAVNISKQMTGDFFPILRNTPVARSGSKKENVVSLLLNNIPEPDPNTPWEQIIDFRSDTETRVKYLALINWANEMASSSVAMNEIQEKYEYLYLQYLSAYNAHKIKSTFGVLEILSALGFSLATGSVSTIPSLISNFFKLGAYTFSFLKDEKSLPGKELSYIYHSREKFGSSDLKRINYL